MKKGEAETAMPHLVDKRAEQAKEPWPPDGLHHYSFGTFWTWLQNNHYLYTQFRAVPNARYVAEIDIPRIAWIIVAAALLIAMMRLPYGYYTFNRIVACGFCTLIAVLSFREMGASGKTWAIVLIMIAIAFNPFIPLRLSRFTRGCGHFGNETGRA